MNIRRALIIAASVAAALLGGLIRDVLPALAEGLALLGLGGAIVVGGWMAATTLGDLR